MIAGFHYLPENEFNEMMDKLHDVLPTFDRVVCIEPDNIKEYLTDTFDLQKEPGYEDVYVKCRVYSTLINSNLITGELSGVYDDTIVITGIGDRFCAFSLKSANYSIAPKANLFECIISIVCNWDMIPNANMFKFDSVTLASLDSTAAVICTNAINSPESIPDEDDTDITDISDSLRKLERQLFEMIASAMTKFKSNVNDLDESISNKKSNISNYKKIMKVKQKIAEATKDCVFFDPVNDKLEIGNTPTPFIPSDPTDEIAKCRKFCRVMKSTENETPGNDSYTEHVLMEGVFILEDTSITFEAKIVEGKMHPRGSNVPKCYNGKFVYDAVYNTNNDTVVLCDHMESYFNDDGDPYKFYGTLITDTQIDSSKYLMAIIPVYNQSMNANKIPEIISPKDFSCDIDNSLDLVDKVIVNGNILYATYSGDVSPLFGELYAMNPAEAIKNIDLNNVYEIREIHNFARRIVMVSMNSVRTFRDTISVFTRPVKHNGKYVYFHSRFHINDAPDGIIDLVKFSK